MFGYHDLGKQITFMISKRDLMRLVKFTNHAFCVQ